MEFVRWLFLEVLSDSITWLAAAGILTCWTIGTVQWLREKRGSVE